MDKEQYIRNMQEILKHYGISGSEYAINKVRDDTVCLVHHDEIAEVFYYNRNTCMRTSEYDSIADACRSMIQMLAKAGKEEMLRYFEILCRRTEENGGMK